MRKNTDIEGVKSVAVDFLFLAPEQNKKFPMFVEHPFFDSDFIMTKEQEFINIFTDADKFKQHREWVKKLILGCKNIYDVIGMIRPKYQMTFLKHAKQYIGKSDFGKLLAYVWVISEDPNQDINVPISTLIRWFKAADKNDLMEKKELEYYNALPDTVTVYRGVAVGRAERKGLSWTCNYDTAKWFSERFDREDEHGYILKGTIEKSDVFAYFNGRNEDEVLCDSSKLILVERIENTET